MLQKMTIIASMTILWSAPLLAEPGLDIFKSIFGKKTPTAASDINNGRVISQSTAQKTPEEICSDKDESVNLGPVRDQHDMGWCFANTGADLLLNAYPADLGGAQVSSSFVALNYFFTEVYKKENKAESIFGSGGNISQAVQLISNNLSRPICLESVDDKMMERDQQFSLAGKLDYFKDLYHEFQAYLKSTDPVEKKNLGEVLLAKKQRIIESGSFLSIYDHEQVINTLKAPTLDEAVIRLMEVVCQNESKPIRTNVKFQNYYKAGNNGEYYDSTSKRWTKKDFSMIGEVNKALDRNKIVAIAYNIENVLNEPNAYGAHASSIVGRKFNKQENRCYYKIRNSWGPDCYKGYMYADSGDGQNKIVNDPSSTPVYKPQFKCEEGNYWASEDDVKNLVFDITYAN